MSEALAAKYDREIKNMAQKQLSSDTQTDNNLQVASEQFQAYKKLTSGQLG